MRFLSFFCVYCAHVRNVLPMGGRLCGLWETRPGRWFMRLTAHTQTVHMHMRSRIQTILSGWAAVIRSEESTLSLLKQQPALTCKCDVEASVRVGVVSQELQSGHMSTGCYRRGQDITGKGAKDGRFSLTNRGQGFHERTRERRQRGRT